MLQEPAVDPLGVLPPRSCLGPRLVMDVADHDLQRRAELLSLRAHGPRRAKEWARDAVARLASQVSWALPSHRTSNRAPDDCRSRQGRPAGRDAGLSDADDGRAAAEPRATTWWWSRVRGRRRASPTRRTSRRAPPSAMPLAADIVLGVNAPSTEQLDGLREGATLVGILGAGLESRAGGGAWRAGRSRRWRWMRCRASRGRSRWTCCQLDGEHRRLPGGGGGGARLRSVLHRPGDRRGQGAPGEGAGRGRRAWPASPPSARPAAWARSCARPTRGPRSPTRFRSLGGEYLSVEAADVEVCATGYAKEMSEDYNARAAALYAEQCERRRHHHHHGADPGSSGAAADHRRDGGLA